jgi:CBS domain-containing protein
MTERERIDRFEAAYNRIDREFGRIINEGPERRHGFASRVRIASNKRRRLKRFADFLLEIGELRNALVHSRTEVDHYLAIPSEETVLHLESISDAVATPQPVTPRFARPVTSLQARQPLTEAWEHIRNDGYSRYPVYDEGRFVGLLTSNGFTRWCAAHVRDGRLDVDMRAVSVADVLAADHRRDAVIFVSADTPIDDAALAFADNPRLEAILITPHGRPEEPPLGLISATDIAAMTHDRPRP